MPLYTKDQQWSFSNYKTASKNTKNIGMFLHVLLCKLNLHIFTVYHNMQESHMSCKICEKDVPFDIIAQGSNTIPIEEIIVPEQKDFK